METGNVVNLRLAPSGFKNTGSLAYLKPRYPAESLARNSTNVLFQVHPWRCGTAAQRPCPARTSGDCPPESLMHGNFTLSETTTRSKEANSLQVPPCRLVSRLAISLRWAS